MNLSPGLLSPLQWGLLLAIPPGILLLYFLKLRREPLEVPSTFLWHRTVEDLHVNSIWQRLRQNLLLFLQLLLVALAIFACLNPNWRGTKLADDRFVFLIDQSASMSATDVVGGSRLDEAKRQVAALIDQMKSGDRAMIIPFTDVPGPVLSYTDNHRLLKRHLDKIQPTDRRSDLEQALRFAGGLANPGRTAYEGGDAAAAAAMPATMYIFSDGRVISQPKFSMGNLQPVYIPIGDPAASNVGIAAFQAAKDDERPDQMNAFAGVRNYSATPQEVELSLFLDDKRIDAQALQVEANGQRGADFTLKNVESGVLRLAIDTPDALLVDNQAFAVLDITQRANILLVTSGNMFLQFAFLTDEIKKYADVQQVTPDYLQGDKYKQEAQQGAYDLIIFDQCAPATTQLMPLSNTVFFAALPAGDTWQRDEQQFDPIIIDTDRSHPLMQFVEMASIRTYQARPVKPPPGATTLVDSDIGSLVAIASRDTFEDLVIGFELIGRSDDGGEFYNTEWPRSPGFPVFVQNVLAYLGGVSEQTDSTIYRPGQMIQLRLDTTSPKLSVKTPAGEQKEIGRGRSGAFVFSGSDQIGIYELQDPANPEKIHRVAVNLFDEIESNIPPVPELQTEYETIAGARGIERTRRAAWKPILLLAFCVLLLEWYVYNRRVYL